MTQIPAPKDLGTKLYLLTIRGGYRPATLEEARRTHNETAGSEASIAASTALGDLSHNVYVPPDGSRELLFLDVWNSILGLQQFFADPHVQAGGGQIFTERDAVVWAQAEGLPRVYVPAPRDKQERAIGLIRGKIRSLAEAGEVLSAVLRKGINAARRHGHLSRDYYVRTDGDGTEILGMDVWTCVRGAGQFYSTVEDMPSLMKIFDGPPQASVWKQPEGAWVEW